jgi:predicted transcriptional regulator
MAMTDGKQLLSESLVQRVTELARQQNREPAEVLEEAVRRYLASCRLERFSDMMGERAREKGIREEHVPHLVSEVRRENEERGR